MAWLLLSSGRSTEALNARVGTSDLPSPQLSLIDKKGYRTDIGKTGLLTTRTGEKSETSAASVVMFGQDRKFSGPHLDQYEHLIWQLGQPHACVFLRGGA